MLFGVRSQRDNSFAVRYPGPSWNQTVCNSSNNNTNNLKIKRNIIRCWQFIYSGGTMCRRTILSLLNLIFIRYCSFQLELFIDLLNVSVCFCFSSVHKVSKNKIVFRGRKHKHIPRWHLFGSNMGKWQQHHHQQGKKLDTNILIKNYF